MTDESLSMDADTVLERQNDNRLEVFEDGLSANCEIVGLFQFGRGNPSSDEYFNNPSQEDIEQVVSTLLAIEHLNTANTSLVPELSGIHECPITFSAAFAEANIIPSYAFEVVDRLTRPETDSSARNAERPLPCAFLGAKSSTISSATAMVTGMRGFPQVSQSSTSVSLNNKVEYPLFGRTIPDDGFMAEAFLQFLHDTLGIRHFFVFFDSDSYPRSVYESLRRAILDLGWGSLGGRETEEESKDTMYLQSYLLEKDADGRDVENILVDAIDAFNRSEFRYAFVITDVDTRDSLMKLAYDSELAGYGDYQWFFADTFSLSSRKFKKDSVLVKAYNGVGSIKANAISDVEIHDAYVKQFRDSKRDLHKKYAKFVREAVSQKETDDDDINVSNATIVSEPVYKIMGGTEDSLFLDDVPFLNESDWIGDDMNSKYTPFTYDATILLGLSACAAVRRIGDSLVLEGNEFFEKIKQTRFAGVTGDVVLRDSDGTREGHSAHYSITNWRAFDGDDDGMVFFNETTAYAYHPGDDQNWDDVSVFVYQGGNVSIPPDLPPPVVSINEVNAWIRVAVYALVATVLAATVGFAIWTYRHRQCRVVKASQPFFLLLLCVGVALMGCSMIPLVVKENEVEDLDLNCNSFAWLVTMGFGITFSTLFAKTYRINTIVRNAKKCRRVKLTVRGTVYPVALICGFNVMMLALMSANVPITHEEFSRKPDRFGRDTEIYSRCMFEDSLPYIGTTAAVNLCVVCLAMYQAWRARDLSTEFAESMYIAGALFVTLSATILAVPLLLIVKENLDALIFIICALVFTLTTSIMCCIFIPKITFHLKDKRSGQSASRSRFSSVYSRASSVSANSAGEVILTSKPQKALISEISDLKRKLGRAEKRERILDLRNAQLEKQLSGSGMLNSKEESALTFRTGPALSGVTGSTKKYVSFQEDTVISSSNTKTPRVSELSLEMEREEKQELQVNDESDHASHGGDEDPLSNGLDNSAV